MFRGWEEETGNGDKEAAIRRVRAYTQVPGRKSEELFLRSGGDQLCQMRAENWPLDLAWR